MTSAALKRFKAFCRGCQWLCADRCGVVRTYIEKDDLRHERGDHEDQQNIREPLVELRIPINLRQDGGAQALGTNDTQATDQAADGEIDEHALLPVSRTYPKGCKDATDDNDASI